jgi:hypothetical protein
MDDHTGLAALAEISFFGTGSMEFYLGAFRNSVDSHKHTIHTRSRGALDKDKAPMGRGVPSARRVARFRAVANASVTK